MTEYVPTSFTISPELARQLRVRAAQNGISRSQYVRELLTVFVEALPLLLAKYIRQNFDENEIAVLVAELRATQEIKE